MDGNPVDTGLGVDVRVYECVPDEFGQRMSEEIGQEGPRERGQVAEGAVDFERVQASEIVSPITRNQRFGAS